MDRWWHTAAVNRDPHLTPNIVSPHKSASESQKKEEVKLIPACVSGGDAENLVAVSSR